LTHLSSYSDVELPEFGVVEYENLKMQTCSFDSSATAVYLLNSGKDYMEYSEQRGFTGIKERHIRIKILDEEALDLANFEIFSTSSSEFQVEAFTFNLVNDEVEQTEFDDDKLVELDAKTDKTHKIYKLSLPKVKVGSIIDIKYKLESKKFIFNNTWLFQLDYPVKFSHYIFEYPLMYIYTAVKKGFRKLDFEENRLGKGYSFGFSFNSSIWEFCSNNIPAFVEEDYMLAKENYQSKVSFELSATNYESGNNEKFSKSWEDISKTLLKRDDFGDQLDEDDFLEEQIKSLITPEMSKMEKAHIIYNYIAKQTKWNGESRLLTDNDVDDVYELGSGSSAEINLLLISALKQAGVKAYPVISSTRDNCVIDNDIPTLTSFNYVLACITNEGEHILMDATEDFLPMGKLPFRCMNDGMFRLLNEKTSYWIKYKSNNRFLKTESYNIEIDSTNNLNGKYKSLLKEYSAIDFRQEYEDQDEYIEILEQKDLEIENLLIENLSNKEKPLSTSFDFRIEGFAQRNGNKLFFNSFPFNFINENPFKLKERKIPIDFGNPIRKSILMYITIPKDFKVVSLPKSKIIKLPHNAGSYRYSAKQFQGKIIINSRFNINNTHLHSDFYPAIKELYNEIININKEFIILEDNSNKIKTLTTIKESLEGLKN
jgi:hypothetical protein